MKKALSLLTSCSILISVCCTCNCEENNHGNLRFPDGFQFGTASSAYQVEGAWNTDGKGESIWDYMVHTNPDSIADQSTADVACDSYNKIAEDVKALKDLNVNFYRFSLSWPRILPTGFANRINEAGINYYNRLINALIAEGITPVITLFHWDLPQTLQKFGGFSNPLIIDWYTDFAKLAFERFGDRVKTWITFNEPRIFCNFGYGSATFAPQVNLSGIADYQCGHNLLLAHANTYHMYKKDFKRSQKGRVGITLETFWYEPFGMDANDSLASERILQFILGWFAHPIFSQRGDYPELMKKLIEEKSLAAGFTKSRLPTFTSQEVRKIKNSADFFGLNHYSTFYVAPQATDPKETSYENDAAVRVWQDSQWESYGDTVFKTVPWGFRKLLVWIKKSYNNPEIFITENGCPDADVINDRIRIDYFKGYLLELLKAINIDKVNVKAYTSWSIMDDFEWNSGYTLKFGHYGVNFTDPNRTRVPRESVNFYKNVIRTGRL